VDNQPSHNSPRSHDREKTVLELKLALNRLQKQGAKITIAAVAKEAGLTPALLHNRYPDFTEEIRMLAGKATRVQRDTKHDLLVAEREKNRELRNQIQGLMAELTNLASENESLRANLNLQQAISAGKVVALRPKSDS
jgi:AcrR family transcriptional regulator